MTQVNLNKLMHPISTTKLSKLRIHTHLKAHLTEIPINQGHREMKNKE